jgi:hypothetical protein
MLSTKARSKIMAAIVVVFEAPTATAEQYDQVVQELEAAGHGRPAERLCHVAAPTANGWYVVDVWESSEALERFTQTHMPLLQKRRLHVRPQIYPCYGIIMREELNETYKNR